MKRKQIESSNFTPDSGKFTVSEIESSGKFTPTTVNFTPTTVNFTPNENKESVNFTPDSGKFTLPGEKKNLVVATLQSNPNLSSRRIAKITGVSHTYVSMVRNSVNFTPIDSFVKYIGKAIQKRKLDQAGVSKLLDDIWDYLYPDD